ncbi:MAG: peroxiredoxin [Steroidobacteraceae bacterium]
MSTPAVGRKVPAFRSTGTDGNPFSSADLKGRPLVLFFYPKDMTSGCTVEARDFRDQKAAFTRAGATIVGVSRDSAVSHQKFRAKERLNFELLADVDESLCKLFDVIKMKNMYGRKVRGIERSTFLIDANGKLVREWRKVKIPGHVAEVLEATRAL